MCDVRIETPDSYFRPKTNFSRLYLIFISPKEPIRNTEGTFLNVGFTLTPHRCFHQKSGFLNKNRALIGPFINLSKIFNQ